LQFAAEHAATNAKTRAVIHVGAGVYEGFSFIRPNVSFQNDAKAAVIVMPQTIPITPALAAEAAAKAPVEIPAAGETRTIAHQKMHGADVEVGDDDDDEEAEANEQSIKELERVLLSAGNKNTPPPTAATPPSEVSAQPAGAANGGDSVQAAAPVSHPQPANHGFGVSSPSMGSSEPRPGQQTLSGGHSPLDPKLPGSPYCTGMCPPPRPAAPAMGKPELDVNWGALGKKSR
jgi:hypothetical protein